MPRNRLTARFVGSKLGRGRYSDGGGLVLQVSKWGTKAWVFRYQRDSVEHHMGLGACHALSLAEARDQARNCEKLLATGVDPIECRKADRTKARLAAASEISFEQCARKLIEAKQTEWRNAKHRAQWTSTLEHYAYPVIGKLSVGTIDTGLVLKCLEPIWWSKPETAKRLRGRIETVLDWATARTFRAGENPARWRAHLDKLLPAPGKVRPVVHHAALPWPELPAFMKALRTREELSAKALELTILTVLRTTEVIEARPGEIDLDGKCWTVPAIRMKAQREHRVPLSPRAVELLSDLPRDGEYVFCGRAPDSPLSNMAMLATLERMGRDDITVHGFRSTFRDWAAESTSFPNHVVEMALAHVIDDKVEAAYRRGDLFAKRKRLMEAWAAYCSREPAAAGDVVRLQKAS